MKKIPKQEYTPEFRELAVKRVRAGQSVGAVARELGLIEQTLRNWVENGVAPNKAEIVTGSDGSSRPMCSYPQYPKYLRGDSKRASSYTCSN